jgi:hypothetical protein
MLKKNLSIVLSLLLLQGGIRPGLAAPQSSEDGLRAARVKQEITRRGTGEKAGVKVKLLNGTELKGYISQAGSDNFLLAQGNGEGTTIAYSEISEVKGKGMSRASKIGIVVGVVAAGIAVAAAVGASNADFEFPGN